MLSYESSEGQLKMTNSHNSKMVCVSSYVSSKNFGEGMQSHIGCICLTFLHCALSNVSSNGSYQKLRSRIDYIYLFCRHFLSFLSEFFHLNLSNPNNIVSELVPLSLSFTKWWLETEYNYNKLSVNGQVLTSLSLFYIFPTKSHLGEG